MPNVHFRIVENVFERTKVESPVGVIKMADGKGEDMDNEKINNAKSNHRQGQVFDTPVNNVFHPMETKMGRKAHLLHRMMNFMELP